MTMITYPESLRSRGRPLSPASMPRTILNIATGLRDEWRRRRTARMLEGLPAEIRKDIGWPATDAPSKR